MKEEFCKAQIQEQMQQAFQRKCEKMREESKREIQRLAKKLSRGITEFEKMSISRSYVQFIRNLLLMIGGSKTEPLMKIKEELELKLKIV